MLSSASLYLSVLTRSVPHVGKKHDQKKHNCGSWNIDLVIIIHVHIIVILVFMFNHIWRFVDEGTLKVDCWQETVKRVVSVQ